MKWGITNNAQSLADVEELPKVNQDGDADSQEREQSNHLATQGAGEEGTSGEEPTPPSRGVLTAKQSDVHVRFAFLLTKGEYSLITKLAELNVCKERKGHEENEGGVEEDQTRLGDMSVIWRGARRSGMKCAARADKLTEKNESSRERGNGGRVARLLHDPENDWDGGGA